MTSQSVGVEGLLKARFRHAEDRTRLARLVRAGWMPVADDSGHPLLRLQGQQVDGLKLQVLLGPRNRFGATFFQVFLQDSQGRTSQKPALVALHSDGRYPAYNWIEVMSLAPAVSFYSTQPAQPGNREVRLEGGLLLQLFQHLSNMIPPGGHMMVEYDSPEQRATERALAAGAPPGATPLGGLLLEVGCGDGFKDWHFAEGGSEGPRKLQGFKALNADAANKKRGQVIDELLEYVEWPRQEPVSQVQAASLQRAADVLRKLAPDDPEPARRVQGVR